MHPAPRPAPDRRLPAGVTGPGPGSAPRGCPLPRILAPYLVSGEGRSQAEEARVRAMELKQISAAVAAIKEKGVLSGLRVERQERGQPGEFDHLSDEELRAELMLHGYRAWPCWKRRIHGQRRAAMA
jgi:hypothetical protein